MTLRKNQSGSAHVIVITILALALVGALGYIFWQKTSVQKDAATDAPLAKDTPTNDLQKAKNITVKTKKFGTNLALTYPEAWTHEQTSNNSDAGDDETITIASPDKSVSVELFQTATGQFGGMCIAGEGEGTISYLEKKSIKGFSKLSYVEAITSRDGKYEPVTYAVKNDETTRDAKVGGTVCSIFNTRRVFMPIESTNKNIQATLQIMTKSFKHENGTAKVFTSDIPIRQVFATDDYKTAVKIIESLRQES